MYRFFDVPLWAVFTPFFTQFETQRTTFVPLHVKKGLSPLGDNPRLIRLIRFFSAEVPLEQPLEGLAVAGFVARHLPKKS